jgi:enoyl-[acyl-carrier-protein] reductase (NADH)
VLAAEFGPQGVRVNAVLPGAIETDMFFAANDTADKQDFVTRLHALKRVARPEEIARAVLYLASDEASFVTGTASLVDGGASITRTRPASLPKGSDSEGRFFVRPRLRFSVPTCIQGDPARDRFSAP